MLQADPSIIYWKWDPSILEPGVLEAKAKDLLSRSSFDQIFIGVHWMNRPVNDPELVAKIEECCRLVQSSGRKMMLELDIRNEYAGFIKEFPKDCIYAFSYEETSLNDQGEAVIEVENQMAYHYFEPSGFRGIERILGSWCFETSGGEIIPASRENVLPLTSFEVGDETTKITIKAGRGNAHKQVLVLPAFRQAIPDLFSPNLYVFYQELFDELAHIPLNGVGVDEWGVDVMIKLSDGEVVNDHLTYSDSFAAKYHHLTGRSLQDDLILGKYFIQGDQTKSYEFVNDYSQVMRNTMVENETWFYNKGKEVYGPDAFIGAHPTWWGSASKLYLEVLKNGLDWWEVPRDYAQTDEVIIYPIRFALARKWGGSVWYNMWYSLGTRRLETYFSESWRNIRYGGRTHYHGYECPNEDVVLPLNGEGMLEQIEETEEGIRRIRAFQKSTPDSRILVVFGMEAVSNWMLNQPGAVRWTCSSPRLDRVLEMTQAIFEAGYLCDLVPSSEIANGSVRLEDGKLRYGSHHDYDALIFLFPEFVSESVWEFLKSYRAQGGKLAGVGSLTRLNGGRDVGAEFGAWQSGLATWWKDVEEVQGVSLLVETLKKWQITGNAFEHGCVYKDGSVIFTADGDRNIGNSLKVREFIHGHLVEFQGEDYLALELDETGRVKRYVSGKCKVLQVDGNRC